MSRNRPTNSDSPPPSVAHTLGRPGSGNLGPLSGDDERPFECFECLECQRVAHVVHPNFDCCFYECAFCECAFECRLPPVSFDVVRSVRVCRDVSMSHVSALYLSGMRLTPFEQESGSGGRVRSLTELPYELWLLIDDFLAPDCVDLDVSMSSVLLVLLTIYAQVRRKDPNPLTIDCQHEPIVDDLDLVFALGSPLRHVNSVGRQIAGLRSKIVTRRYVLWPTDGTNINANVSDGVRVVCEQTPVSSWRSYRILHGAFLNVEPGDDDWTTETTQSGSQRLPIFRGLLGQAFDHFYVPTAGLLDFQRIQEKWGLSDIYLFPGGGWTSPHFYCLRCHFERYCSCVHSDNYEPIDELFDDPDSFDWEAFRLEREEEELIHIEAQRRVANNATLDVDHNYLHGSRIGEAANPGPEPQQVKRVWKKVQGHDDTASPDPPQSPEQAHVQPIIHAPRATPIETIREEALEWAWLSRESNRFGNCCLRTYAGYVEHRRYWWTKLNLSGRKLKFMTRGEYDSHFSLVASFMFEEKRARDHLINDSIIRRDLNYDRVRFTDGRRRILKALADEAERLRLVALHDAQLAEQVKAEQALRQRELDWRAQQQAKFDLAVDKLNMRDKEARRRLAQACLVDPNRIEAFFFLETQLRRLWEHTAYKALHQIFKRGVDDRFMLLHDVEAIDRDQIEKTYMRGLVDRLVVVREAVSVRLCELQGVETVKRHKIQREFDTDRFLFRGAYGFYLDACAASRPYNFPFRWICSATARLADLHVAILACDCAYRASSVCADHHVCRVSQRAQPALRVDNPLSPTLQHGPEAVLDVTADPASAQSRSSASQESSSESEDLSDYERIEGRCKSLSMLTGLVRTLHREETALWWYRVMTRRGLVTAYSSVPLQLNDTVMVTPTRIKNEYAVAYRRLSEGAKRRIDATVFPFITDYPGDFRRVISRPSGLSSVRAMMHHYIRNVEPEATIEGLRRCNDNCHKEMRLLERKGRVPLHLMVVPDDALRRVPSAYKVFSLYCGVANLTERGVLDQLDRLQTDLHWNMSPPAPSSSVTSPSPLTSSDVMAQPDAEVAPSLSGAAGSRRDVTDAPSDTIVPTFNYFSILEKVSRRCSNRTSRVKPRVKSIPQLPSFSRVEAVLNDTLPIDEGVPDLNTRLRFEIEQIVGGASLDHAQEAFVVWMESLSADFERLQCLKFECLAQAHLASLGMFVDSHLRAQCVYVTNKGLGRHLSVPEGGLVLTGPESLLVGETTEVDIDRFTIRTFGFLSRAVTSTITRAIREMCGRCGYCLPPGVSAVLGKRHWSHEDEVSSLNSIAELMLQSLREILDDLQVKANLAVDLRPLLHEAVGIIHGCTTAISDDAQHDPVPLTIEMTRLAVAGELIRNLQADLISRPISWFLESYRYFGDDRVGMFAAMARPHLEAPTPNRPQIAPPGYNVAPPAAFQATNSTFAVPLGYTLHHDRSGRCSRFVLDLFSDYVKTPDSDHDDKEVDPWEYWYFYGLSSTSVEMTLRQCYMRTHKTFRGVIHVSTTGTTLWPILTGVDEHAQRLEAVDAFLYFDSTNAASGQGHVGIVLPSDWRPSHHFHSWTRGPWDKLLLYFKKMGLFSSSILGGRPTVSLRRYDPAFLVGQAREPFPPTFALFLKATPPGQLKRLFNQVAFRLTMHRTDYSLHRQACFAYFCPEAEDVSNFPQRSKDDPRLPNPFPSDRLGRCVCFGAMSDNVIEVDTRGAQVKVPFLQSLTVGFHGASLPSSSAAPRQTHLYPPVTRLMNAHSATASSAMLSAMTAERVRQSYEAEADFAVTQLYRGHVADACYYFVLGGEISFGAWLWRSMHNAGVCSCGNQIAVQGTCRLCQNRRYCPSCGHVRTFNAACPGCPRRLKDGSMRAPDQRVLLLTETFLDALPVLPLVESFPRRFPVHAVEMPSFRIPTITGLGAKKLPIAPGFKQHWRVRGNVYKPLMGAEFVGWGLPYSLPLVFNRSDIGILRTINSRVNVPLLPSVAPWAMRKMPQIAKALGTIIMADATTDTLRLNRERIFVPEPGSPAFENLLYEATDELEPAKRDAYRNLYAQLKKEGGFGLVPKDFNADCFFKYEIKSGFSETQDLCGLGVLENVYLNGQSLEEGGRYIETLTTARCVCNFASMKLSMLEMVVVHLLTKRVRSMLGPDSPVHPLRRFLYPSGMGPIDAGIAIERWAKENGFVFFKDADAKKFDSRQRGDIHTIPTVIKQMIAPETYSQEWFRPILARFADPRVQMRYSFKAQSEGGAKPVKVLTVSGPMSIESGRPDTSLGGTLMNLTALVFGVLCNFLTPQVLAGTRVTAKLVLTALQRSNFGAVVMGDDQLRAASDEHVLDDINAYGGLINQAYSNGRTVTFDRICQCTILGSRLIRYELDGRVVFVLDLDLAREMDKLGWCLKPDLHPHVWAWIVASSRLHCFPDKPLLSSLYRKTVEFVEERFPAELHQFATIRMKLPDHHAWHEVWARDPKLRKRISLMIDPDVAHKPWKRMFQPLKACPETLHDFASAYFDGDIAKLSKLDSDLLEICQLPIELPAFITHPLMEEAYARATGRF